MTSPLEVTLCDENGQIIGHVGICRTDFESDLILAGRAATLHMIDWLGSAEHRSIGASLMRLAHAQAPTQFGVGGSVAGRTVIKRGGYEPRDEVPVYQRVLRPSHWLRIPELGRLDRAAHLLRDLTQSLLARSQGSRDQVALRKVTSFDQIIEPIIKDARRHAILTSRTSARLNHFLRFPRQTMSGWQIMTRHNELCGFALLSVVPRHGGRVRLGKIVDCLLSGTDIIAWSAAIQGLTDELQQQGADLVQAFAGPPWMTNALRQCGFSPRFTLEFSIRDRQQLLPRGIPFHLMPIEADYGYT